MQFKHNGKTFLIGDPWRDSDSRPWRSLSLWTANGWQFVMSFSFVAGRNYYDGDTIDAMKDYVRRNY